MGKIITQLMPHQKYLLKECLKHPTRSALFADLGTGKSLVCLALADAIGVKRILITQDKTNIEETWPVEIASHTSFKYGVYPSPELKSADIWCVGYDLFKHRMVDFGQHQDFDMWIGDESAAYKNPRTWRVKALRHLIQHIPNRIILSGLPVSEHPYEEIHAEMLCLDDGEALGKTITEFRRRYMLPDVDGYGWVAKRNALAEIREAIQPYVVTLPPGQVPHMPERYHEVVYLEQNGELRRVMNEMKKNFGAVIEGKEIRLTHAVQVFTKLHQLTGGTMLTPSGEPYYWPSGQIEKLNVLDSMLHHIKTKCVIWCKYIAETELVGGMLGAGFLILTGQHSSKQRKAILGYFQNTKEKPILIISLGFAKGLNALVDVPEVIFYSRPFSYVTYAQAQARTCRLGGSGTRYWDLVVRDSVDEDIFGMLAQKKSFVLTIDNFRTL